MMDKSATTWWDNLKLRTTLPIAWDIFVQEFNDQFYTRFHRDLKRQEFFRLRQFGKTIIEYEAELRNYTEFVPKMVNFEEYLCSEFEEGLTLKIWEKMSVLSSQSYKEVV